MLCHGSVFSTAAETDLRFTAQSVRELTLLLKFLWSNDMYKVMLADDEANRD